MNGLRRFLSIEWKNVGISAPIYIGGSFVSRTPTPADIDVVLELSEMTDNLGLAAALALRFNHNNIKSYIILIFGRVILFCRVILLNFFSMLVQRRLWNWC
ncbi:MAG: hypothetical protein DIZ78_09480 [endosymbiont of Escarpia spicata]|uniref:Uncharacterized protein n=1 Tax=endosymbiont of Escarpia spicata TaxID=2200908 RepID=A0A370DP97_9GAMM|nr:MAG: hypothetical protein DIZ78_09480 [endosymbiont of Escarpia spicata]